ncbi:Zinc finger PMZ-type [Arabidopsis thaliana x Arabidopsis arenosa]|uniref:Zinc finger PMZ-type n=1 Tax=Arabidopsis thaliana x Arabidopsis arenosa TaxID=1240361 RepID=A0A8T1YDY7_9BRAS|nr:Zinc finger PMZ-type [Arabidopsis thaliana x Arabidopsis arenosa]
MDTRKVTVFCYWNGCIKDGYDGPFYEGSSPRVIRVDSKIELSQLLDDLHLLTGFEKGKFQIDLIGRYPSIVQQQMVKYVRLPIVDDCSLEILLEVLSHYPSISNVDLYLEVKPVSDQATRKRSRQGDTNVDGSVRDDTLGTPQKGNSNGWLEDEENTDDGDCGIGVDNAVAQKDSRMKKPGLTKGLRDSVSKQVIFSSSWLDERELHVGMIFIDKDELEKAVELYSNRRQREYIAYEDRLVFMCKKRKICGWVLNAAETKSSGFEITEYTNPHTCKPVDVGADFLAGEIKGLIKAHPSLPITELSKWVKKEFGYTVSGDNMWNAKKKAITTILGDLDKSCSVLPKLMAALCSSNKMVLDWQYDSFPDPMDASFRSVFLAFPQSIEGFPHCRPLILVDTVDLSGKYPGKMLVAAGLDAENSLFPLAFAITTQESLSADTWRWFFACIRKKVTQREGICLITSPNPDIVAVVNEPEFQWAQHRFCLRHLCFKFYDVFKNNLMTEFVYKAGSTKYISSFDDYLMKIEEMNPEARKWLDQISLHQWALAHDSDRLRFGIMTTNLIFTTYSFINKARDLPITACILLIFDHLAELFKTRLGFLDESLKNRGEVYATHVMTKLEEYKLASRTHDVLPLDQTPERFQVTKVMQPANKKFFVHCSDRVCTCQTWQVYKYPCSHVIAVCRRLNFDHLQYVNDFYKTESFRGVYAAVYNPLPGVSDWLEASEVPRPFPPGSPPRSAVKPVTTESPRNNSAKASDANTGASGQSETRRSGRPKKPNSKYGI